MIKHTFGIVAWSLPTGIFNLRDYSDQPTTAVTTEAASVEVSEMVKVTIFCMIAYRVFDWVILTALLALNLVCYAPRVLHKLSGLLAYHSVSLWCWRKIKTIHLKILERGAK